MLPSAVEQKNGQEYSFHVTNRNSVIATFGEGLLQIDLGLRRSFPWVFTLADTRYSLLGVDFFASFQSPRRRQASPSIGCLNTARCSR